MTSTDATVPKHLDLARPELFMQEEAHEAFRILRKEAPVHWNPGDDVINGFWSITKHEDIIHVSRNPTKFISSKGIAGSGLRRPSAEDVAAAAQQGNVSIITMDPPQHVKYRRIVNKAFTPRAVNQMEPLIREITNEILDNVAGQSSVDFVTEISSQLPLAVICGMLGLPRESWPLMFELTNSVLGSGDPEYQTQVPEEQRGTREAARIAAQTGRMRMMAYFTEVMEQRRREPGDDMVSILLEGEVDGQKLTEFDILAFCFLLILAGNETTRNGISGGLLVLSEHPEQMDALKKDFSLMDNAVEEMIRWVSPLHHMSRVATEDTEIRGQKIREGERVIMWYPSANRDEDIFDDPYKFDITRDPNEHIAFGIGEHFCLGAEFARREMKVMFEELFTRFPKLEVAGAPERLRSNFINGIKHLPVNL